MLEITMTETQVCILSCSLLGINPLPDDKF